MQPLQPVGMSGSVKMDSFDFKPIGFFKSQYKYKYDAPRQSVENKENLFGEVALEPGFNLGQALKGIEGFDRIWLIYQFHKNENWRPLTETPRATEKQGVFATRSPYRPNPIGMSCVKLEEVGKAHLMVSEYDLLDGTPILDIKPYIPHCDRFDVSNKSWIEEESPKEIQFSKEAEEQLRWLESEGLRTIRGFVMDQLKRDPINKNKKRLKNISENKYELSYRTWRVKFEYDEIRSLCSVFKLYSGYNESDLLSTDDKYEDKNLHREFKSKFKIRVNS